MKRIGIIAHPTKPEAKLAAAELRRLAGNRGMEYVDDLEGPLDLLAAVGGDGTILRAATVAHARRVPILGVNVGRLGFLSSLQAGSLGSAVDAIAEGHYILEPRMMLQVERPVEIVALNEVVVERAKPSRVIRIRVSIDSVAVATYAADGFIVATPTGSTAYSLSAGGPVLEPELEALVLTPISAHYPLWRSIVVQPKRSVSLEVVEGTAAVTADGEPTITLDSGEKILVKKHPVPLHVLHPAARDSGAEPPAMSFFHKLRSRFNLESDR